MRKSLTQISRLLCSFECQELGVEERQEMPEVLWVVLIFAAVFRQLIFVHFLNGCFSHLGLNPNYFLL